MLVMNCFRWLLYRKILNMNKKWISNYIQWLLYPYHRFLSASMDKREKKINEKK